MDGGTRLDIQTVGRHTILFTNVKYCALVLQKSDSNSKNGSAYADEDDYFKKVNKCYSVTWEP